MFFSTRIARLFALAAAAVVCSAPFLHAGPRTVLFPSNAVYQKISGRKVKIMPLGNSITSAFDGQASYRYWLWKTLERTGYAWKCDFVGTMHGVDDFDGAVPAYPDFDQDHEGHRGRLTENIWSDISMYMQANVPDIVLWHMGTNDIGEGIDPNMTRIAMKSILDTIRAYNPNVVIIMGIVIDSWLNYSLHRQLNELTAWLGILNDIPQSPIILVDMFSSLNLSTDYMGDRLHPNQQGEQKLAARWFEALRPVLNAMIGKPCEISPPSGNYGQNQSFDFMVTLRIPSQSYYIGHEFYVNGVRNYTRAIQGTRADGGKTFRIRGLSGSTLGTGQHTLAVKFNYSGGFTALADTVVWNVEPHTEP